MSTYAKPDCSTCMYRGYQSGGWWSDVDATVAPCAHCVRVEDDIYHFDEHVQGTNADIVRSIAYLDDEELLSVLIAIKTTDDLEAWLSDELKE